jgi:copper resistance protein B
MKAAAFLAIVPVVLSVVAVAQDPHAGHKPPPSTAPSQSQPSSEKPKDTHAEHQQLPPASPSPSEPDPHAGHRAPPPATDPHAGHAMPEPADETGDKAETASALPVGNSPAPPVIKGNAADAVYGTTSMARARDVLNSEHGGALISKVMANILEFTTASGDGGYRWDVEGWYGGDLHRFVVKTEGEGLGGEVDAAEIQALYSRALGRYTDLQTGVRYDFEPDGLAYATVGAESLLPYWFDVEGAIFLSERGDAFARLEGSYDLRFTQRLILQPRLEVTLAAQDVPESDIGSGFSSAEVGLRLRYDIRREFAPYLGINFEKSLGRTADLIRASGGEVDDTTVVLGLRAWF